MRSNRRLARAALIACAGAALAGSFPAGRVTDAPEASAANATAYTLKPGDRVRVPAVGQVCVVTSEGGFAEFFCARPLRPQHQVAFFRDRILVGKVGNPDRPAAWSGKP